MPAYKSDYLDIVKEAGVFVIRVYNKSEVVPVRFFVNTETLTQLRDGINELLSNTAI